MNAYKECQEQLLAQPKIWLITGVAGFIGSNLLEALLRLNQSVVGLDNFSTGYQHNLDQVQFSVSAEQWSRFRFVEGDIKNIDNCHLVCDGVDFILHQAALGSVPRSVYDPIITNQNNIDGFLNILVAARDANVKRFIYAASSSTYGDCADLPKVEENIGQPLSPYAVTKLVNELYAQVFAKVYKFDSIGLRYFNVFGPRQDPNGAYAAVIPKWINAMIKGGSLFINGDGETSRDFCYVTNIIQANLLAATTKNSGAINQVYNVALGHKTTLNDLFISIQLALIANGINYLQKPVYSDFREGDVRHSQADIAKACSLLGYTPSHRIQDGIDLVVPWYMHMQRQEG